MFPVQGSQVRSLVGEPRFHMLLSTPEEREKRAAPGAEEVGASPRERTTEQGLLQDRQFLC